jgi:uncharacterized alpha/beta hydrolase family protein
MSKILYIHGYGTESIHQFRPKQWSEKEICNTIFELKKEQDLELKFFHWGWSLKLDKWQSLNPLQYLRLYITEQNMAKSTGLLNRLNKMIKTYEPEIIICHSMGSFILVNYLTKYGKPESVKKLVTMQADFPRYFKLPQSIEQSVQNKELKFYNIYCPWDELLPLSMVINLKPPAGMFGVANKHVKNIMFPLYDNLDFHNSILNSTRAAKFLKEL